MNLEANRTIRERSGKKGHALMLLWLLAEPGESPSIPEIAEILCVSERHIKRLIEQCETDGDLKVTRGQGRGHRSQYHVTYLVKGDTAPLENTASANKNGHVKGDIKGDASPKIKGDIPFAVSPISPEIKGDIANPPHTPHKDNINININTKNKNIGANAPNVVSHPSSQSDHHRMMRELGRHIGAISDGAAQGKAIKWLLENHTADDAIACLNDLMGELKDPDHWRESRVSWLTVKKEIGTWKIRGTGESNGKHTKNQSFGKPPVTRDFSKYPARTG